ncbi:MAG: protein kinase, partial [Candidatus Obscuribacterales bacterium]|nr:protein kinase [Candidatus Obscuribacterales bacterium]
IAKGHDGELIAKVLDFGIAKKLDDPTADLTLTRPGTILGSPLFMSPEQSKGLPLTAQSDAYSLGCVMWNALVGLPPFEAENLLATLLKHQTEDPGSMQRFAPELPPELIEIVDGLLAKEPHLRPDLKKRVIPIFEKLLQMEPPPVESRSGATDSRTQAKRTARFRFSWLLGSVAVLIVFVASASIFVLTVNTNSKSHRLSTIFAKQNDPTIAALNLINDTARPENANNPDLPLELNLGANNESVRSRTYKKNKIVNLSESEVTDDVFEILSGWQNLQQLILRNTNVGSLKNLGELRTLTVLNLDKTAIRDVSLDEVKKLPRLRILGLAHTTISDQVLPRLAQIRGLEELDLKDTPISFQSASSLLALTKLQIIDVSKTPITESGLRTLATIPSIKKITVNDCKNIPQKDLLSIRNDFINVSFVAVSTSELDLCQKAFRAALDQHNDTKVIDTGERYLGACVATVGSNHRPLISLYLELALAYERIGNLGKPRVLLLQAKALAHRHGDVESEALAREHLQRIVLEANKGFLTPSLRKMIRDNHKFSENSIDKTNPRYPLGLISLGDACRGEGKFKEALAHYRKCLDSLQRVTPRYGQEDPTVLRGQCLVHMAHAYSKLERIAETNRCLKEGLAILSKCGKLKSSVIAELGVVGYEIWANNLLEAKRFSEVLEVVSLSTKYAKVNSIDAKYYVKLLQMKNKASESLRTSKSERAR